jgi:hypothetical protein
VEATVRGSDSDFRRTTIIFLLPSRRRLLKLSCPCPDGWTPRLSSDAWVPPRPGRRRTAHGALVTEYGKGAASSQGIPASGPIGVIQVQFSRCHPDLPGAKKGAGNETGTGPPREVGQTEVAREVEPPIDVVSVRYTR